MYFNLMDFRGTYKQTKLKSKTKKPYKDPTEQSFFFNSVYKSFSYTLPYFLISRLQISACIPVTNVLNSTVKYRGAKTLTTCM